STSDAADCVSRAMFVPKSIRMAITGELIVHLTILRFEAKRQTCAISHKSLLSPSVPVRDELHPPCRVRVPHPARTILSLCGLFRAAVPLAGDIRRIPFSG